MSTSDLVEWQIRSPKNGMVMCWWTHPLLELIEKWDWSDATMLETGGGRGTAWLRERCKWVDTIEASLEWAEQIKKDCSEYGLDNGEVRVVTNSDKNITAAFLFDKVTATSTNATSQAQGEAKKGFLARIIDFILSWFR